MAYSNGQILSSVSCSSRHAFPRSLYNNPIAEADSNIRLLGLTPTAALRQDNITRNVFTEQAGIAVTHWTRIRQMLGSNLGWDKGYPDSCFSYSPDLYADDGYSTSAGPRRSTTSPCATSHIYTVHGPINSGARKLWLHRDADKSLAFPISYFPVCSTAKIIFLGWVKEVITTKS
jgi:hypothetical protein